MSLLQGVLRSNVEDRAHDSDDDEWVNVQTAPGTPRTGSRAPSRAQSPTRASQLPTSPRLAPRSSDPLRAFPTEISQRIFGRLNIGDLARCSRVCKRWNKSQTLNYVWFQHYRKENFHDESLPPGKWTKRESKQNWRTTYIKTTSTREPPTPGYYTPSGSGARSGYQTPSERNQERWQQEDESRPSKVEMREMYKELGGRKSKAKGKFANGPSRDRGGLGRSEEW
ncbi:hypothetical protein PUNSTDRAFT_49601 [Punctularia strigosozonata HHB-11173 SS5]|uniref:uncharacterized protein n=1 Tax=Punctularia strigosozonata (strain HHB-11173) TaxID=741275 RepID=UPI0004416AAE|nr:uncharacterized protein PUNSTDRAFT_49601 [Punctularia strigosozonata HHB-11173 SS5]EIN12347.1 hypothetical protein PUNSTDRAFT_49601 [Punctularia strigosozonata HHB-11173 SS5]